MNGPVRVLVIGGGQNSEHEVSLASALAVSDALRSGGFDVTEVTIGRDGLWRAHRQAVPDAASAPSASAAASVAAVIPLFEWSDAVFPALHGRLGEDGALAALCALLQRPCVGSGIGAGAIGLDKWATKLAAAALGIRTAPGRLVRAADLDEVVFERPVVVKPVTAGSSHGVSLVREAAALPAALHAAAAHDDRLLLEDVVSGREIDVAVLREAGGRRWAAPPLEIHAAGLFDTAMKYNGSARFTVPARLTSVESTALTESAFRLFDALECRGVARLDFFLTDDGPVLNEVNTMPGLTAASQVPRMFAAAGLGYDELLARMVAAALA